jgi:hypothetical protein
MNNFLIASKKKLRFNSKQGSLTVEDLWDLPLTSTRANVATLDDIAIALDQEIKNSGTTSFVKKTTRANEEAKLKFDIVLEIINIKQDEANLAEERRVNAEKKQQILQIIAAKENEALAGKSIDELKSLVGSL